MKALVMVFGIVVLILGIISLVFGVSTMGAGKAYLYFEDEEDVAGGNTQP